MFNDFHETTRNVGMMGIILALLVLAGFCGLGMAVTSGFGKKGPSMEARLVDQEKIRGDMTRRLKQKKADLEGVYESATAAKTLAVKFDEAAKKLAHERVTIAESQEVVVGLNEDLDVLQLDFEEHREKYRTTERAMAIGETLDLSSTKGADFKKCKVLGISPLHLRVMRSAGPIGIPYQDLPLKIQDRFQFGLEEATAYRTKLNASNANRDKRIAAWKKDQKTKKGAEAHQALIDAIAQAQGDIAKRAAYAKQQDSEEKAWEKKGRSFESAGRSAKAAGRISSATGKARQARNRAAMHGRRATDARSAIVQLEKDIVEYQNLLSSSKK